MARILITNINYFTDFPSGPSRVAYDLAHGLAQEGHKVWYLCQDVIGGKPIHEVDGHVTVLRYRLASGVVSSLFFRHVQHFRAARRVLQRYLPEPPDVVHGHSPLQYLATRHLYRKGVRWCYTVHSPCTEEMTITWRNQGLAGRLKASLALPLLQRMEKRVLRSSDALTALSDYTCSLLEQRYGSEISDRIRVIPGWARFEQFHPLTEPLADVRKRLKWPTDRPVFFTLRRLEPRMGLSSLLRALSIAHQRFYKFHMIIGGSGTHGESLASLCNSLGLGNCVTFMGNVSEQLVATCYGACDAFIIPTGQLECFGLIALEALACGKPVLVTPIGALPGLIGKFEKDWIAASASPEDIAELVCRYLDGMLPSYAADHFKSKLQYYAFSRAMGEYTEELGLA